MLPPGEIYYYIQIRDADARLQLLQGSGTEKSPPGKYRKNRSAMKKEELKPMTVPVLAVAHYGAEHQKRKAVEEMAELITALAREQDGRATEKDVITEIADVHLMIRQLIVIYGVEKCLNEYMRKQKRLLRRIDRESAEKDDKNTKKSKN